MRKLGRKKGHRELMMRNLITSVIMYEKVITTLSKAKEVRSQLEKTINIGKKNDLIARRRLNSILMHENAVKKILEELVPRYQERSSGYLRIYKLGKRLGDNSEKALIQLIPNQTKKITVESNKKEKK